jgi:hypothetical protein
MPKIPATLDTSVEESQSEGSSDKTACLKNNIKSKRLEVLLKWQ